LAAPVATWLGVIWLLPTLEVTAEGHPPRFTRFRTYVIGTIVIGLMLGLATTWLWTVVVQPVTPTP